MVSLQSSTMNPYSPPNPIDAEHQDEGLGLMLDVALLAIGIGLLVGLSLLAHLARG